MFLCIVSVSACLIIKKVLYQSKFPITCKYQTDNYEMVYDSTICHPTYRNLGNSICMSGEVWQFIGYENEEIYIDSYTGESPYVQKGVPVIMIIDELWHTYDWDKLEISDEEEILKASAQYFRSMIQKGGNDVLKEERKNNEIIFSLADSRMAKVKIIKCQEDNDEVYYGSVFCQYDDQNDSLNKEIQKMYESFVERKEGNVLFTQENIKDIEVIQECNYDSWDYKLDFFKDWKERKIKKKKLLDLPINEITEEEYHSFLEKNVENGETHGMSKIKIRFGNGKNSSIQVFQTVKDYCYMKYKGRYYIVLNDEII